MPIKPARSREFNPFHRKHHQASNASSERRSNKTAFVPFQGSSKLIGSEWITGWCFRCSASPLRGMGRHPSMPSAWIGFMGSNLLASTVIALLRTSLPNRTGRGTSHVESRNDWIRTNDTCALQDVRPLHHACGRVSS